MLQMAKVGITCGGFLGACLAGLISWGLGGPAEVYAIARIDGWQVVPIMPMFGGTCYPAGFTNANYLEVTAGDTPAAVRARLGEPLEIYWGLDPVDSHAYVWFKSINGQWVTTFASNVDVPDGTPMSSLIALRSRIVDEGWDYSRSCIPDDSKRVRWINFSHGRMVSRSSGIYYD